MLVCLSKVDYKQQLKTKNMYRLIIAFSMILSVFLLTACEEEYIPDLADAPPEIVVEGYIEAGQNALPPYVLLTRSTSFFSSIDSSQLNELFVHDAMVRITNETDTINLQELCLSSLDPVQQQFATELLGLGSTDSIGIDICVYIEPSFTPQTGEEGKRYDLEVIADGKRVTATTTIPYAVPLDSVRYVPTPDPNNDTLVELRCYITDRGSTTDFYRYFTQQNNDPLYPGVNSVIDDVFFNGESFEFPLARGQLRTQDFDLDTFGYFWKGDTIMVKWCTIDQAHYQFWSTLEFNSGSEGPFASFTRVDSNIEGGLGVWGGYAASYHELIVPE